MGRPSDDKAVQTAVERIISGIGRIRPGETAESCLLFPMFTSGGLRLSWIAERALNATRADPPANAVVDRDEICEDSRDKASIIVRYTTSTQLPDCAVRRRHVL
ncbi:hypothetical protein F4809DRAFT_660270 [Biscogniauxia mediterranea]|nr:hypothetical protein F4809DRAFT_660270 [Biscogniauxia mediterranea]